MQLRQQSISLFHLTLLRARGAASGVLGDVDSLAVSDVELSEELLLDNSLLDGLLVANCRTQLHLYNLSYTTQLKYVLIISQQKKSREFTDL